MQTFRIDAVQFDDLRRAGEAADKANRRGGNSGEFGEEPDDRLVCLAIHRKRGDVQLPCVSMLAGEFSPAGSCADLKRESRFHVPLFSAMRSARAGR